MSKVKEEAILRLKNRTTRLLRLINLNAPEVILINEAYLVAESAKMLNPESWYQKAAANAADRFKTELRLCCHEGCEEQVAWIPSDETPTCPGPFHGQSCLKHAFEDEKECTVEDLEEENEDMEDNIS